MFINRCECDHYVLSKRSNSCFDLFTWKLIGEEKMHNFYGLILDLIVKRCVNGFFYTLNTTKLLKVTCYSCAETRHPRDCNVTTQCHAHQVSDRNSVQSPKIASSLKIMVTISTCSNKNVILLYFWYWICSSFRQEKNQKDL